MIVLFALFVIAALLLVLFAFNMEEAKKLLAVQSQEFCESYIEIKKVRLAAKGLSVQIDNDPLPDASYFMIAAALALVCAMGGFTLTSLFFTFCFACCFADFLEQLKDIHLIRFWQTGRGLNVAAA
jgi:hypothetical protein